AFARASRKLSTRSAAEATSQRSIGHGLRSHDRRPLFLASKLPDRPFQYRANKPAESAFGCSLHRASRSWSIDSRPSPSGFDILVHPPAPHRAEPRSWPHLRPRRRGLFLHAPRTTVVGNPELRRVSWTKRLLSRPPAHLAGCLGTRSRHSILG